MLTATRSAFRKQAAALSRHVRSLPEGALPHELDVAPESWEPLGRNLAAVLSGVAQDGGRLALEQVMALSKAAGPTDIVKGKAPSPVPTEAELIEMMNAINEQADEWAQGHAAELVGMHCNPDGTWTPSVTGKAISNTTRDGLKALVDKAIKEGWGRDDLASAIEDAYEFSEERADMISQTEIKFADVRGNRIGWQESSVVIGRRWYTSEHEMIEACPDCEAMDGKVAAIDGEFEGGADIPLHPRCLCNEEPILSGESMEETADE